MKFFDTGDKETYTLSAEEALSAQQAQEAEYDELMADYEDFSKESALAAQAEDLHDELSTAIDFERNLIASGEAGTSGAAKAVLFAHNALMDRIGAPTVGNLSGEAFSDKPEAVVALSAEAKEGILAKVIAKAKKIWEVIKTKAKKIVMKVAAYSNNFKKRGEKNAEKISKLGEVKPDMGEYTEKELTKVLKSNFVLGSALTSGAKVISAEDFTATGELYQNIKPIKIKNDKGAELIKMTGTATPEFKDIDDLFKNFGVDSPFDTKEIVAYMKEKQAAAGIGSATASGSYAKGLSIGVGVVYINKVTVGADADPLYFPGVRTYTLTADKKMLSGLQRKEPRSSTRRSLSV